MPRMAISYYHLLFGVITMLWITFWILFILSIFIITALIERNERLELARKFKRRAIRYYWKNPEISQRQYGYYADMERKTGFFR